MSTAFLPKNSLVADRMLKTQRLVIPFSVTANATPASVVLSCDEPGVLFLKSEGVDYITAELTALGDSVTYANAPVDANGIMNMLIVPGEEVAKVCRAQVMTRTTGVAQPCFLGDADGLTAEGNIALTMDSAINFATTDAQLCLEVEYVVADGN